MCIRDRVETEGQKVFLPLWVQGGNLLQFDPETQWAKKQVKPQNVTGGRGGRGRGPGLGRRKNLIDGGPV